MLHKKAVDDAGPGATDAQKQALTDAQRTLADTLAQSKTMNDNAQATLDAAQKEVDDAGPGAT